MKTFLTCIIYLIKIIIGLALLALPVVIFIDIFDNDADLCYRVLDWLGILDKII